MKNEAKQKRIKRVFSNSDQVLHLWANQSQDSARSKNVFFEGDTVYSYGRHYPLGRIGTYKGQKIAFINDTGYSNTTAKHIRHAKSAASHLIVLTQKSGDFDFSAKSMRAALLAEQGELVDKLMGHFSRTGDLEHTRNGWNLSEWIAGEVDEFNKKCAALGFKTLGLEGIKDFDFRALWVERVELNNFRIKAASSPEALEKKALEKRKRDAAKIEKNKAKIDEWVSGGPLQEFMRRMPMQFIRVKGDLVQTTGGADVPLFHALVVARKLKNGTLKPGQRVGHFSVDAVSADVLKIGCHTICVKQALEVLSPMLTGQLEKSLSEGVE